MKHPAIISTLLDRQAVAVDKFIKTTKFNIITPRLFSDTHQSIAKRNQVECHIIENEIYNNTIKADCKKEEARIISLMSESKEDLKLWLKEKSYPDSFSDSIINHAINRTPKLVRMFLALESLKSKHDIKALFINQEYMIHEASLLQWCKANTIPVVHICHSPYPARSVASVRHFISDHVTLASERCTETLDDIGSKECIRHITGMVNWDTYRNIDFTTLETFRKNLSISDDALIISFFTTYPAKDCSTGDPEVYHKTLNVFLSAASTLISSTKTPIHFIVKDRPSGASFTKEEISSKAKKLGLENHLSYVFDRPEAIVVLSDITISSGSSIAFESMAMGKATVDLVPRQNFLSSLCFGADDGVIQVNAKGLVPALKRLIEDEDYREEVTEKGFNNQRYVYPTQELRATQDTTALLLDICDFKEEAQNVRDDEDFYDNIEDLGTDSRFHQVDAFQLWRSRTQPNELAGQLMGERYNLWKTRPTFHLIIVVDQTLFSALANTIDSFELQIYPHYGISVISTDPCPDPSLKDLPNFQWIDSTNPFGDINDVIKSVTADWVMQLWPGDELQPQALFNLADYANINSDWLVLYGDEVIIKSSEEDLDDDQSRLGTSKHTDPVFKPDFNLDLLRSTDYVNRATAIRKDAWEAMDGFRSFAYRQTEDMVFRIAERMTLPAIGHLPFILVHRSEFMDKLIAHEEYDSLGAQIRQEHLKRCGFVDAQVLPGLHPQIYNTRYYPQVNTVNVDLLITTSGLTDQLSACLTSLQEQSSEQQLKIHIAVPDSAAAAQSWIKSKGINLPAIQWIELPADQFNFTSQVKNLINAAHSEYFVLACDRVRWVQKSWLTPLLDQLQRPDVAMASPRLVSSRASIVSAGQILGKNGLIGDLYQDFFLEQEIQGLPRAWCEQNFNALNPACIGVKRSTYLNLGGVDSQFNSSLAINDLQLRLCTKGHRLVWTPLSSIVLTEKLPGAAPLERKEFLTRWFNLLCLDPAFNFNLQLRDSGAYPDTLLSGSWHPVHTQRTRLLFAALDPHSAQLEALKPIAEVLRQVVKEEKLQLQDYTFSPMRQIAPASAVELARLHPDIILYMGDPSSHQQAIQEVAHFTQIQQWVIIYNADEWAEWSDLAEHLSGVLLMDDLIRSDIELLVKETICLDSDTLDGDALANWLAKIQAKEI